MRFRVLKNTASGNLLLQSDENKPLERKMLFASGKRVALVFDTIASTKKPFYLAKPILGNVEGILVDGK